MTVRFLFLSLLLVTTVARADPTIEIGPGVCDTLVNYIEEPGVEYQPGIDAGGNPVAPADIGAGEPMKFPQHIVIPITDYLAARLGASSGTSATAKTSQGVISPQIPLGTVTLDGTRLMFNGQPLGDDVDGELGKLCQKARQTQP